MAGRCGCGKGCSCCVQSSESVTVAGSGAAGTCYKFTARMSADPGNQVGYGSDGGLFSQPCLTAPTGGRVSVDPDTGCSLLPAPVILGYDHNPIAPVSGTVQLPPAAAPALGCGLVADESGNVLAQTSGTWPLDDLAGNPLEGDPAGAGLLFCDPDGNLRSAPEHTAVTATASGVVLAPGLTTVATTYDTAASPTLTVVAPSTSRQFVGVAAAALVVDLVAPTGAGALVRLQTRIDGGSWVTATELRWPEAASGPDVRSQLQVAASVPCAIGPGDTWTLEIRGEVHKAGGGSDPTIVSVSASAQFMGVTV